MFYRASTLIKGKKLGNSIHVGTVELIKSAVPYTSNDLGLYNLISCGRLWSRIICGEAITKVTKYSSNCTFCLQVGFKTSKLHILFLFWIWPTFQSEWWTKECMRLCNTQAKSLKTFILNNLDRWWLWMRQCFSLECGLWSKDGSMKRHVKKYRLLEGGIPKSFCSTSTKISW